MKPYKEVDKCRICGNKNLFSVLHLGTQHLSGVFPKSKDEHVASGPLELVKCEENSKENCGLVQIRQTYNLNEMYGFNYGYRSGLNQSMVKHLHGKVAKILSIVTLKQGDLVVDIGSNDGTTLSAYPSGTKLMGVDPTIPKFKKYYPDGVELVPDFFTANKVLDRSNGKKATVVTSIAMFYDLESPMDFVRDICNILDDDGIWVLEQGYLLTVLEMTAYDTICHEHLEYYGLRQIKWMMDQAGLKIIDVETNNINGGSFSVTVAKSSSSYKENKSVVDKLLESEKVLAKRKTYEEFAQRVFKSRDELREFFNKNKGKKILGYGASTKGNILLQFCNVTPQDIPFIGEVNEDKYGSFTPGTLIPITSEKEAKAKKPDFFIVLPWHFKEFIVKKEQEYIKSGGKFVFPLPSLHIV